MKIFRREINGKLHVRIEYTEEEKSKMKAKQEQHKAEIEAKRK
jgi:RNase H-fold protein (predicted Holliday junction resolvase)